MMLRAAKALVTVSALGASLCTWIDAGATQGRSTVVRTSSQEAIQREIESARTKYDIPAMTVAVWENDKQMIRITRGVRAADSAVLTTDDDRWHLGSCGKVMTAVVILRLVDRGILQLDTPIASTLPPPLKALTHPALKQVTIAQLLSHTSGIYDVQDWRNAIKGKAASRFPQILDPGERELWQAVSVAIERKPEHAPGEVFQYSNLGYTLAGFVAARVARTPWQQLVRDELFQPLGLTTASFGLPGKSNVTDQPRGHEHGFKWLVVPTTKVIAPTSQNADPAYYDAAGLVSMSMRDWSVFLRMVLAGHQSRSNYLTVSSFARLLTPVKSKNFGEYGFGVHIAKASDGKSTLLGHTGSNGYWRARFEIDTTRNRVVLMAANLGGESVDKAFADVLKTINRELL